MRKPAIAIGLAFIVALVVWGLGTRQREPVYEGRALSDWLDRHVPTTAAVPPFGSPGWKKADEALRAIGTNGIPVLLAMIQAKDPPKWARKPLQFARRIGLPISQRPAMARIEEAEYAFQILNTNAVVAVPELIRIYQRNVSAVSQNSVALALGHIGRGAREALPTLIRDFTHTNQQVRFYAVSAVSQIGGERDLVLPALIGALKDTVLEVRWNALTGISQYWRGASNAVPEILKMTNDPAIAGGASLTQQVATTLWYIAPEKTGLPITVEDASPICHDTLTAQALKMELFGERKVLIPSGKPLPASAQYWNSDPRPSLKIYRGLKENDEADQFLGEFEVMDVDASSGINVSTLVIVCDGRIVLTARDNTHDKFLPIRRLK